MYTYTPGYNILNFGTLWNNFNSAPPPPHHHALKTGTYPELVYYFTRLQASGFYERFPSKYHRKGSAYYRTLSSLKTPWNALCPVKILVTLAKQPAQKNRFLSTKDRKFEKLRIVHVLRFKLLTHTSHHIAWLVATLFTQYKIWTRIL